jgi:hypothetical protein
MRKIVDIDQRRGSRLSHAVMGGMIVMLLATASTAASTAITPSRADHRPVTLGEYRGGTSQLCPQFAIVAGLCGDLEKLPISFKATRTKISQIRATVVEQCEDNLPPQLVQVAINRSYRLVWEDKDRAHFNARNEARRRNAASGFVRRQVANGYLTALHKSVNDPSGEAYCYASVQWRATPQ